MGTLITTYKVNNVYGVEFDLELWKTLDKGYYVRVMFASIIEYSDYWKHVGDALADGYLRVIEHTFSSARFNPGGGAWNYE